jgi:Tfp pilus assembly protein PilN
MRAVNLLPPDLRSASSKGKGAAKPAREPGEGIGAFVLLGALAFCVVALAGYVLTTNTVKERQTRLAEVSAQSDATLKRAADLKPYADFQTLTAARVGTVQALANSRFDWEQAFRDLSRAIPSNVHLTGLTGSLGGASAGGSGLRGAINAPAIELSGCTRSQPAVARLMSRLRNIDGVTRVSLSKSEKAEVAATAAPVVDGSGSSETPGSTCGKGSPPTFEIVTFFEGAAAQAALATTATSAAPAATTTSAAATPAPAAGATPAPAAGATPAPTPATTGGTK